MQTSEGEHYAGYSEINIFEVNGQILSEGRRNLDYITIK